MQQLANAPLSDATATDLATQVTQLQGVEGVRTELAAEVQRSVDKIKEAVSRGDEAEVEAEGIKLKVLDTIPELRGLLFGQVELSAERASELFAEYSRKLAEEAEKGAISAEEVLADTAAWAAA